MKSKEKKNYFLIGTFLSAILASSCCLPALVFLLFGSSAAWLSFFEPLHTIRVPLMIASMVFFILFVRAKYIKKCSNSCSIQKDKTFFWIGTAFIGCILICLLFYPEILGKLYE